MPASLGPDELDQLPRAREDTEGFFDYRPLSADAEPPSDLIARHRLARREAAGDGEDGGGRLRLAFVTGYDADADWLDCLAYVWRAESDDAVWALERWEQARSVLPLYVRDASFEPQALDRVHRRLRERGDEGVAEEVREVLGG
ncbi:MAG: hypothetical protein M3N16_04435 [Actinomycetota bacterium]|nr:hypothetical protein [Actinomycetota bacterium]